MVTCADVNVLKLNFGKLLLIHQYVLSSAFLSIRTVLACTVYAYNNVHVTYAHTYA